MDQGRESNVCYVCTNPKYLHGTNHKHNITLHWMAFLPLPFISFCRIPCLRSSHLFSSLFLYHLFSFLTFIPLSESVSLLCISYHSSLLFSFLSSHLIPLFSSLLFLNFSSLSLFPLISKSNI